MFRHFDHDLIEPDPLLAIHIRRMYTEQSIHGGLRVSKTPNKCRSGRIFCSLDAFIYVCYDYKRNVLS